MLKISPVLDVFVVLEVLEMSGANLRRQAHEPRRGDQILAGDEIPGHTGDR